MFFVRLLLLSFFFWFHDIKKNVSGYRWRDYRVVACCKVAARREWAIKQSTVLLWRLFGDHYSRCSLYKLLKKSMIRSCDFYRQAGTYVLYNSAIYTGVEIYLIYVTNVVFCVPASQEILLYWRLGLVGVVNPARHHRPRPALKSDKSGVGIFRVRDHKTDTGEEGSMITRVDDLRTRRWYGDRTAE